MKGQENGDAEWYTPPLSALDGGKHYKGLDCVFQGLKRETDPNSRETHYLWKC